MSNQNRVIAEYSLENIFSEKYIKVTFKNFTKRNIYLLPPIIYINKEGSQETQFLGLVINRWWNGQDGELYVAKDTTDFSSHIINYSDCEINNSLYNNSLYELLKHNIDIHILNSSLKIHYKDILFIPKSEKRVIYFKIKKTIIKGNYNIGINLDLKKKKEDDTYRIDFNDIYKKIGTIEEYHFYDGEILDTPYEFEIK